MVHWLKYSIETGVLVSSILFQILIVKIDTVPIKDMKDGMKFLNRFGYISDKHMSEGNANTTTMSDFNVQSSLKIFQEYAGIKSTGDLNSETMELMNKPRCGNKDISVMLGMKKSTNKIRRKRYSAHSRWNKNVLTYHLVNYPKCCINSSTVDQEVALAFQYWEKEIPMANLMIRKNGIHDPKADIEIKFTTDPHEDGLYFGDMEDMSGRAVAHAFYPAQETPTDPIRGDIHFNDNEKWTSGLSEGQTFLQTVTHEVGHTLGLAHSLDRQAVMYFRVLNFDKNFKLNSDDVQGIQMLYENDNAKVANIGNIDRAEIPRSGTVGALRPNTRISRINNQIPFPNPLPPLKNSRKHAVHCQKLINQSGHTIMIAEQCVDDDKKESPEEINNWNPFLENANGNSRLQLVTSPH